MRHVVFALVSCWSSLALADAKSVAVLDIQGTGVEPNLLPTLTEILTVEIAELGTYKVIAGRDVEAMIGFERQKDVLGCSDAACLAELGGALGVDRIVSSHIGKVGSTFVVNIKLINIKRGDTEGRVYETVQGEVDVLINTIKKSVKKLLGGGTQAAAEAVSAPATSLAKADAKLDKPTTAPAPAIGKAAPSSAAPQAAPTAPPTAPPTAIAPSAPAPAKSAAKEPAPAVATGSQGGGMSSSTPSLVLFGVGAATLAGGVFFGLKAKSLEKCANDSKCVGGQEDAAAAPGKAMLANILYGAGLVSVGAGVVWMLMDHDAPTALVPVISAHGAGVAYTQSF